MSNNITKTCGCGAPSVSMATMSLTLSRSRDLPTVEIDQNINWLSEVKKDCEFKVHMLQNIKKERLRVQRWRDGVNELAQQFCDPQSVHLDKDTRIGIIQQRLGCNHKRASDLADIVTSWANNYMRKERNAVIMNELKSGISATEIAKKHSISRQHVYNIKRENKPKMIPKKKAPHD